MYTTLVVIKSLDHEGWVVGVVVLVISTIVQTSRWEQYKKERRHDKRIDVVLYCMSRSRSRRSAISCNG